MNDKSCVTCAWNRLWTAGRTDEIASFVIHHERHRMGREDSVWMEEKVDSGIGTPGMILRVLEKGAFAVAEESTSAQEKKKSKSAEWIEVWGVSNPKNVRKCLTVSSVGVKPDFGCQRP
ncbi:hypothetical protein CDAR_411421 [Caerostris darwini]|uniref:Uncharacterized protein n=1 Tax=Caerostris darwini TaxID=1538125 RepID=A0AAV4SFG4_9ARAC|nr:hypothetical protein CDAR_411421 [Caerostris darwini]